MLSALETAANFCKRAAELRNVAEDVIDRHNRDNLLRLAESYETMAQRLIESLPNIDPSYTSE